MIPRALILLAVLAAQAFPARAEWVAARGERLFTTEMSEAEACRAAEERAKEDAIRQVTGERLASEDLMICEEKNNEASCSLNRSVWNTVDGDVRAVRNRRQSTEPVAEGVRKCLVALEAEVVAAKGEPDPGFDVGVKLNTSLFRHGDPLEIQLAPSRPMHVSVFQWLPYERGAAQVMRLFPNTMDHANRLDRPTPIPTPEGRSRYSMRVGFPEGQPSSRRMVDEYLMVVATKQPVEFRDEYSLDDFRARLLELPRPTSRIVRKAYSVVRAP